MSFFFCLSDDCKSYGLHLIEVQHAAQIPAWKQCKDGYEWTDV